MARALRAADSPEGADVTNTVHGQIRLYDCPDLQSVDNYLLELARRVERATKLPKLLAQYRADQDSLLDRRLWLEMIGDSHGIAGKEKLEPDAGSSA